MKNSQKILLSAISIHSLLATPDFVSGQNGLFSKPLYRGMRNNEVKQLQEFLRTMPDLYPEGLVTSYFGPLTDKAVKKFQEKNGIENIGIVGPKTRKKLNELVRQTDAMPGKAKQMKSEEKIQEKSMEPEKKKETAAISVQRIFPEEETRAYQSWEKINSVLSAFGITAVLVDEKEKPVSPKENDKEMMRASLANVAYVLDSIFRQVPMKAVGITKIELLRAPASAGKWINWGNIIKIPTIGETDNHDEYKVRFIHETAHSVDMHLWRSGNVIDDFRLICWDKAAGGYWLLDKPILKQSCFEQEKSFVPSSLAFFRTSADPTQKTNFYSAQDFKEDFAESVTAYVVSPREFRDLAKKFPKLSDKYNFIKVQVFNGHEF